MYCLMVYLFNLVSILAKISELLNAFLLDNHLDLILKDNTLKLNLDLQL